MSNVGNTREQNVAIPTKEERRQLHAELCAKLPRQVREVEQWRLVEVDVGIYDVPRLFSDLAVASQACSVKELTITCNPPRVRGLVAYDDVPRFYNIMQGFDTDDDGNVTWDRWENKKVEDDQSS